MKLTAFDPDLKTIVDRIDGGDIDLQPDFQRQEIWPIAKKRKLIDTIIRGWSVPPIFLVEVDDARMEVLDGQQRLAAIRDYVHNVFSIDGTITPPDEKVERLDGTFYSDLLPSQKRMIDQYPLRCFRITDYQPDEPSELFYRLNQPTMLTAGEQRNAFYGPAREQLKELVGDFESWGNAKETIGFSNARLAYDDIVARLLVFVETKTIASKGTESLISQRFKERRSFDKETYLIANHAIMLFSRAREVAGRIKLNKANALSWLLFYARSRDNSFYDHDFMGYFVNMLPDFAGSMLEAEAARLFKDRSSLRVTDVSSVIYRDFALWLTYLMRSGGELPAGVNERTLIDIGDLWERKKSGEDLEDILNQNLDQQAWGKL